ncbi:MAG: sporulation protein YqfC [Eubacteriaceae bacterium]|nr:sporulation protein YqfC [Eubacteriaceae bacterium]
MGKLSDTARLTLTNKLGLTPDAIMGEPLLKLVGVGHLSIENHRGIVKYTETNVKINTSIATISVSGERLLIKSMIPEEIIITGQVSRIEYIF